MARVGVGLFLTALYLVAAKVGLRLALLHPSASPVWPPTGIALAAMLLLGPRLAPAIFIGAFVANVTTAGNVATSLGIAAGNTLECVLGAHLVHRFAGGLDAFDRPATLFRFVLLAAMLCTALSATIGVGSLALGGFVPRTEMAPVWLTWWLGDAVGAILLAPLLVLWVDRPRPAARSRLQSLEAVLLLMGLAAASWLCFGSLLRGASSYPLTFLPLPFLVWAGFRFGQRATTTAALLVGVLSVLGTLAGCGPFAALPRAESLLLLQIYLGFAALTALTVATTVYEARTAAAALQLSQAELDQRVQDRTRRLAEINTELAAEVAERQQAQQELADSEAIFRGLLEAAPDALVIADQHGRIRMVNSQAERSFGYDRQDLLGQPVRLLIPDLRETAPGSAGADGKPPARAAESVELLGRRKDGSEFALDLSLSPVRTKDGLRTIAAIRDVTRRKRAEREQREQELLRAQVEALSRRTREIATLNRMSDLLRAVTTVAEAHPLVPAFMTELFPGDSGALYVFNSSRGFLESVATWGDRAPAEAVMQREECWALRRGHTHRVDGDGHRVDGGAPCPHLRPPHPDVSVCIPMVAQGETLGLFHLVASVEGAAGDARGRAQMAEYKQRLAQAAAEQVAGALANAKMKETLRTLANRDPLTGLLNRRSLAEALDCELLRAKRRRSRLGMLMIDIDHFKRFNDEFGHAAGDVALRELGKYLLGQARKGDMVCRFGGEEMIVVFADCKVDDARARAEQLRLGAKALRLEHDGRALGALSLSMGVAMFPDHGRTVDELLAAADAALYCSKSEGRDRTSVAGSQRLVVEPAVVPAVVAAVEPSAPEPGPIARPA